MLVPEIDEELHHVARGKNPKRRNTRGNGDGKRTTTPSGDCTTNSDAAAVSSLSEPYQLKGKDFFVPGRIFAVRVRMDFKMLRALAKSQMKEVPERARWNAVRRYVAVRSPSYDGTIPCLEITTYGGQGWEKSGVKMSSHVGIYSGSRRRPLYTPEAAPGAVFARVLYGEEYLGDKSLVCLSRLHDIPWSQMVKKIGRLPSSSLTQLQELWKTQEDNGYDSLYIDPELEMLGDITQPAEVLVGELGVTAAVTLAVGAIVAGAVTAARVDRSRPYWW